MCVYLSGCVSLGAVCVGLFLCIRLCVHGCVGPVCVCVHVYLEVCICEHL